MTTTPLLSADDVHDAIHATFVDGEHRTYPAETVDDIIAYEAAEYFGGLGSRKEVAEIRTKMEQAYARGVQLLATHDLVYGPVCDAILPYSIAELTEELTDEYGDRIASVFVRQHSGYVETSEQHCAAVLVRKATQ